jgi:DNA gyrase subunit A
MGRATQGVRLINLEKRNDEIASVCKVLAETDEEEVENTEDITENEDNNNQAEQETDETQIEE